MKVYEIGIVLEGLPLVSVKYEDFRQKDIDQVSKGALITSLLHCAENAISPVESFEGDTYSMIFKKGEMNTARTGQSDIIFYIIIDRKKELSKKSKKKVIELANTILNEFTERYNGVDTTQTKQFKEFESFMTESLEDLDKSFTDRLTSLF
jgi:hypothetical protein